MYFPVVLFILGVLSFVGLFKCKLFYESELWCSLCVSEHLKFYYKIKAKGFLFSKVCLTNTARATVKL